jgi:hypothetical protein
MVTDGVSKMQSTPEALHLEEGQPIAEKMSGAVLTEYAKEGNENEHDLTVMQAIKMYPSALFWALAVIMEGKCIWFFGFFYLQKSHLPASDPYSPSSNNTRPEIRHILTIPVQDMIPS